MVAWTPSLQSDVITRFGLAIAVGPDWKKPVARLLEAKRPKDEDAIPVDADLVEEWAAGVGTVPEWVWDAIALLCGTRAGMLKQCAETLSNIKSGLDQR